MKNFYIELFYILDNYHMVLLRAEKKLKKKKHLKERFYKKLACNKPMEKLFCNTIDYPEDKDIKLQLKQLESLTNLLKQKNPAEYTYEELNNTFKEINQSITSLKEFLETKIHPWEKYVSLFKLGTLHFGKMKACYVILLWFAIFVILPVIGNMIILFIK